MRKKKTEPTKQIRNFRTIWLLQSPSSSSSFRAWSQRRNHSNPSQIRKYCLSKQRAFDSTEYPFILTKLMKEKEKRRKKQILSDGFVGHAFLTQANRKLVLKCSYGDVEWSYWLCSIFLHRRLVWSRILFYQKDFSISTPCITLNIVNKGCWRIKCSNFSWISV